MFLTRQGESVWPLAFSLGLFIILSMSVQAQRRRAPGQEGGRLRPPTLITCDRNHLTSYTGRVVAYSRRTGRTTVRIATDENTEETVTLKHPRTSNSARWFMLRGEAFQPGDWAEIESSRGRLHPHMRVTAWVCDDGRNAILDWQPQTAEDLNAPPSTP